MDRVRFALLFPSADEPGRLPEVDDAWREFAPTLVLAPEALYGYEDRVPVGAWARWAKAHNCSAVVGAARNAGSGAGLQELFVATPSGSEERRYTKHSTAGLVAWDYEPYDADEEVRPYDVPEVGLLAPVICHDAYLGGLFGRYARQRPALFTDSTFGGVIPEKWHSVLRLRALEHAVPVLCTMHQIDGKRFSGPFAFDADGRSIALRRTDGLPGDDYRTPGVFLGDVALHASSPRRQALSRLAAPDKQPVPNGERIGPFSTRLRLRGGRLEALEERRRAASPDRGGGGAARLVLVRLDEEAILDYWRIFRALDEHRGAQVVFQSWWSTLPAKPEQLAHLLLGRCLENMAPFVLTDNDTIYEVVEIAGATKVMRRSICQGDTAWVDLRYALGLRSALKMAIGTASPIRNVDAVLTVHRAWAAEQRGRAGPA